MNDSSSVTLVTGAGQGIGAAIARRLGSEGHHVIVVDKDGRAAEKVAAEVGGDFAELDVTDGAAVRTLAAQTPRLDGLVNNAGIFPAAPIAEVDADTFRKVMDVNVLGPLHLTQAFLPQLTESVTASVVNIASIAAKLPTPGTAAYSPSKAAVVSLTKLCAVELASHGIRFNAVAPGGVATEGTASYTADPAREERFNAVIPLGKRGLPEDIADVIPFFLGPDARYITGQVLYVDGGLSEATLAFLRAVQSG